VRRLRCDGGFLTIWMLGICLLLLALGGVSLDLWRAFSHRQALAGLADAAALAGASGIDEAAARAGVIRLDPAEAAALANRSIEGQPDRGSLVSSSMTVSQDGSQITVRADGLVSLTLLRLVSGQGPIPIHVSSTAQARRSP
jgi:Flp pilus assembly protein TadG